MNRDRMAVRIPRGMKLVNLLLGSWTTVILLFLYLPIAILIVYSFNLSKTNIRWEGFTTSWYAKMFHDTPLVASLNESLLIACIVTVISVILGALGAWLLYR